MKYGSFFLLFNLLFTIFSCQNQTNILLNQPDPVLFPQKTHPMDAMENGIDSVPEGDAILINWYDHSGEEDWQYNIYRATDLNAFSMIDVVRDTFYIDEARQIQQTYYYYVTAVNEYHEESEASDTLQYTLLYKPTLSSPQGKTVEVQPEFLWQDRNQPVYFVLRLYRIEDDALLWLTRVELEFGTEYQKVRYNHDGLAHLSELDRSKTYKWRVDAIGANQFSGAKSQWMVFNY